jgi:hypothetical protein
LGAIYGFKLLSGPSIIREYPSAATGTYKAGEVVGLQSGACVIGANQLCAGVALKDAVTSGTTPILIITPEQLWEVGYNGTTAATMEGEDYLVTFTTTAQCVSSTTTTPTVTVEQLDPRDGAKAYGRLQVRFNRANCQMSGLLTAAA